jgi:hypothetical protein
MSPEPENADSGALAGQSDAANGEERLAQLAVQFATGDLDNAGLQDLYALLNQPGNDGAEAARLTWEALRTTTDLRSALGSGFQDTVRHKLDEHSGEGTSRRGEFVDGVKSKLGLGSALLPEVRAPRVAEQPPSLAARLVIPVAAALALVAAVAWLMASARPGKEQQIVASAIWARGPVTVEMRPITLGSALDRRPLVVGPGGRMVMSWPAGHRATVVGPALVVPQGDGLSLSAGDAWFEVAGPFTLGLPDMQLKTEEAAAFAVTVTGDRSMVGVKTGTVSLKKGADESASLSSGWASAGPHQRFKWIIRPRWEPAANGAKRLSCDVKSVPWRFSARAILSSRDDALIIRAVSGAPAVGLQAGELILRDAPSAPPIAGTQRLAGQHFRLTGAPLLERNVVLKATADAMPDLSVTGLEWELPLKIGCPFEVLLLGNARLQNIDFHVGPSPTPPD